MPDTTPETKEKLLSAARQLLVAHGSAGLRIDAVAEIAGVNKRMIYHHFGDKAGLVAAVYEGANRALGQERDFPDNVRLLAWQVLEGAAPEANPFGGAVSDPAEAVATAARLAGALFGEVLDSLSSGAVDWRASQEEMLRTLRQPTRVVVEKPRVRLKPDLLENSQAASEPNTSK